MTGQDRSGGTAACAVDLGIAEAFHAMIVHHAYRLHKGVADGRAHEVAAAFFKILAHGVGLRCSCRYRLGWAPGIHQRLSASELPDIAVERTKFLLSV